MKYLSFFLLLPLLSCTSGERLSVDSPGYQTSGVEQYFLPELPAWSNFSEDGHCYKSGSFQYLDFPKIATNFQLNYSQIVELQGQYNDRRESYFSSTAVKFLKPVEEASFFSNAVEQVKGGIKLLQLPATPAVDVIWLESYANAGRIDELKKMASSGRFDQNLPLLFSSCLSRQRLSQWVQEHGLGDAGLYLLSAEWLGAFDSNNQSIPGLRLELSKILNPGTKVHFLVVEKATLPNELTY